MFNSYYNAYQTPYNAFNQPFTAQSTQGNIFSYVNGLEGAKAFLMPPNGKAVLMDSDNPIFYFKSSNEMGQSSIRIFRFEEIKENENNVTYASEEEIKALKERVDNLEKTLKKEEQNNG